MTRPDDAERPEKPTVHTTFSGRQYVDANELVQSKAGREEIKRSNRAMRSKEAASQEQCHKCGIPADRTCRGCGRPLCFLCDLDDTNTCNKRCEKKAREPDLFTQEDK